jgi:hypothetical protein
VHEAAQGQEIIHIRHSRIIGSAAWYSHMALNASGVSASASEISSR